MMFGIRDVRRELGRFNGDNCGECTEGSIYQLAKITRYLVILFINLIPLRSRFEAVCDSCGNTAEVSPVEGKTIAKREFKGKYRSITTATVLRLCAFALVLAAAVALPLTLVKPAPLGPQAIKDMVTEDGIYSIQDADGHVMGIVEQKGGVKTLTFYEKTTRLAGEPGADGSFIRREYYKEAAEGGSLIIDGVNLERIADTPGVLEDRYGVPVRIYHYDAASQSLGYAQGIDDLTSIAYQKGRVDYPLTYRTAEGEEKNVAVVLYLEPDRRVQASYVPNNDGQDQLAVLTVKKLEGGRVTEESTYTTNSSVIALATQQGISHLSTIDAVMTFIQDNGLIPANVLTYHYFGNTKVYAYLELSMPDNAGSMQSVSQTYEVAQKGSYYVQHIIEEE